MKINDILRASGVKRWHIVRTIRDQSLAEHSFDVCMIARAIAKEAEEDDYEITKAALLHDLDEVVTGDPPSQTKRRARERGWDLNALYKGITGREISARQEMIIHVADKLADLYWLDEHRVGKHGDVVMRIITEDWGLLMKELGKDDPALHKAVQSVTQAVFSREFVI